MTERKIYTRAYSTTSPRQLISGKGSHGSPLSHAALEEEFKKHLIKSGNESTALISCSTRILDTVQRAFDLHYNEGLSPADICIVFLELDAASSRIHSAKELAKKFKDPESDDFDYLAYDVVVEWAIPEQCVVHKTNLQYLMDRGLHANPLLHQPSSKLLSTMKLRKLISLHFRRRNSYDFGVSVGVFAQIFGVRAPVDWIAERVLKDCVRAGS